MLRICEEMDVSTEKMGKKNDDTHYDDFGWAVDEPYVQVEGLGFDDNYLDSDRGC